MSEIRGVWLAVGIAMISIAAGGWATAALSRRSSSEYRLANTILGTIGLLGVLILVLVVLLVWSSSRQRRKLLHYKHDYVKLDRRSLEIEYADNEAGSELLDQVTKLTLEVRNYLYRRNIEALAHFSIDTELTELTFMEGTFPNGRARTEIQLRLKRLTELTS